jgi:hypothetical protein
VSKSGAFFLIDNVKTDEQLEPRAWAPFFVVGESTLEKASMSNVTSAEVVSFWREAGPEPLALHTQLQMGEKRASEFAGRRTRLQPVRRGAQPHGTSPKRSAPLGYLKSSSPVLKRLADLGFSAELTPMPIARFFVVLHWGPRPAAHETVLKRLADLGFSAELTPMPIARFFVEHLKHATAQAATVSARDANTPSILR